MLKTRKYTWNRPCLMAVVCFIVFPMIPVNVVGQDPSLSLVTTGVCEQSSVFVPVRGQHLADVGSMTLFIEYNASNLSFESLENINPQLPGILVNTLNDPPRVAIVWSNINGAQFPDNVLFDLKFGVVEPDGMLQFTTTCEVANLNLEVIPVNYSGGSVVSSRPVIQSNPENKTITSQSNAVFQLNAVNASGYAWQESQNGGFVWSDLADGFPYIGTHSAALTIQHVPSGYNAYKYRCIIENNGCTTVSSTATLYVDSTSSTGGQLFIKKLHLHAEPNPFSGSATLVYTVPTPGDVTIKLFTLTGQLAGILAEGRHQPGEFRVDDKFVYLPAGLYICKMIHTNDESTGQTFCKINKYH